MTKQYPILTNEVTDDFVRCWQSAVKHLQSQIEDDALTSFRANLIPPFLEHLGDSRSDDQTLTPKGIFKTIEDGMDTLYRHGSF